LKYLSTRGEAENLDFADVLLRGLAADGGLYLPESWPVLSDDEIADLAGLPYSQVAERVIAPFVGDAIPRAELAEMLDDAYGKFGHPAVAPLVQIAPNEWLLELFHGRTLAFKDVAMQLLARLMDHALARRGERATIIGATSGDTGGAAIEAFRHSERVDVFILYPHGRVSDVQRRQMTTVGGVNVHALAIDGNFDDCQRIVKSLFADSALRQEAGLSGVNSINWARIVSQIVYYFTAAAALGAPHRRMRFVVPTGNFGDIFAGYAASRMGLPMTRLTVATNVNDILVRTLESGRYEVREVMATASPSMDIQVSSNFERLLFEASGRNAAAVRSWMAGLSQSGGFAVDQTALADIRGRFDAARIDEAECAATMRRLLSDTGYLADPHTAVGIAAARRLPSERHVPTICLATAHPAKFPQAVEAACGRSPALPEALCDLHQRPERFEVLPPDDRAVSSFIRRNIRLDAVGTGA
jgi:threonine synthase